MTAPADKPSPLTIKDEMVRREVEQVRRMGLEPSVAAADRYAVAQLERAAARNAEARLKALTRHQKKQRKSKQDIATRLAQQNGYTFRKTDAPDAPLRQQIAPCATGQCKGCIQCRRLERIREIKRLGGAGDQRMWLLAWELVCVGLSAQSGRRDFALVAPNSHDENRIVTRKIEDILDKSISSLGEWR